MKWQQRRPWLQKASENDDPLCSYCWYAEWHNYGPNATDWWVQCRHPLEVAAEEFIYGGPDVGQDCWGFRPSKTRGVVDGEAS